MSRIGKSDSQANAEALARRGTTYADEHAASWQVRFNRPSHETRSLRDLVRDLRRAYADEVPSRIHVHETDAGGDPAWSPEFTRYITAGDGATDRRDAGTTEIYVTPFRACLDTMSRATDPSSQKRATLVQLCIVGDASPIEAAMAMGVPAWCAKVVAKDALEVFMRRLSDIRLDLRTERVA